MERTQRGSVAIRIAGKDLPPLPIHDWSGGSRSTNFGVHFAEKRTSRVIQAVAEGVSSVAGGVAAGGAGVARDSKRAARASASKSTTFFAAEPSGSLSGLY